MSRYRTICCCPREGEAPAAPSEGKGAAAPWEGEAPAEPSAPLHRPGAGGTVREASARTPTGPCRSAARRSSRRHRGRAPSGAHPKSAFRRSRAKYYGQGFRAQPKGPATPQHGYTQMRALRLVTTSRKLRNKPITPPPGWPIPFRTPEAGGRGGGAKIARAQISKQTHYRATCDPFSPLRPYVPASPRPFPSGFPNKPITLPPSRLVGFPFVAFSTKLRNEPIYGKRAVKPRGARMAREKFPHLSVAVGLGRSAHPSRGPDVGRCLLPRLSRA